MAESLCTQCASLCCRYFALPLDNPTTAEDLENIRWYLIHDNVVVYVEDKQWYIAFMSRCKNLLPDGRCADYDNRPRICRKYTTADCDFHGGDYGFEHLFTSAEQLQRFARKVLRERRLKARNGSRKSRRR